MRTFLFMLLLPVFFVIFIILTVYAFMHYGILPTFFVILGLSILPFLMREVREAIRKRRKNEFEAEAEKYGIKVY
ncbi:MAG: hypothetical protein H0Z18_06570 [Thermococcus sp.]|uniref:hypothetical protein n=1 Tax=Thermococcus sp. TaxID=35749 RepID=UPI001DF01BB9|nr:hypothetical protein [Thermococcus sp.]MBO8174906.1 hypothetical protein [Thermococcus sp.]